MHATDRFIPADEGRKHSLVVKRFLVAIILLDPPGGRSQWESVLYRLPEGTAKGYVVESREFDSLVDAKVWGEHLAHASEAFLVRHGKPSPV